MLSTLRLWTIALALVLAAPGCGVGTVDGRPDDGTPPGTEPPPDDPVLPTPSVYVRGSLKPLYQLAPRSEYGRFEHKGVNMADADFFAAGVAFTSSEQKLDEVGALIAQERNEPSVNLITNVADRDRARQIPFRGNPSDVDFVQIDGATKVITPLGGDLMTPGNEVAITTLPGGQVQRIRVGVRPQRVATHESGLAFVCNQYSNYITVIDVRTGQLLRNAAGPVEIATEYYCTDLLLVERNPQAQDVDQLNLYVANGWRSSVLRYGINVIRDGLNNRAIDVSVVDPVAPLVKNEPAAEIRGVGTNPYRLALSEAADAIYVANNRGGELSRIQVRDDSVSSRVALGAPSVDVVQIADTVFVPTTMKNRGLLSRDEDAVPQQVSANPVVVTGLDGAQHVAHPGALFDDTRSYNFEDIRNGMFAANFLLADNRAVYFTDDVSSEPNFAAQQKILRGALPQAVVRNRAGTHIYVALSGSDLVQRLDVQSGAFRLRDGNRTFSTLERPFALALNEAAGELYVATWGGESLEVFDINSGVRLQTVNLGYASPSYPATNMERGEYLYYNAKWSNNGRKSCASCHLDELLADGIGYSNGATAPTAYHQVPANFNQLTTDSYFWNGSFANGSYTSLALAAQTRTNCELVLFGMIEGISSDPAGRIGDPNNRVTNGQDAACRPIVGQVNALPTNFDDIVQVITAQKQIAGDLIQAETGLTRDEVFRFVDFYNLSELRLPPNPLRRLADARELDSTTLASIERGKALFTSSGCATCHDPTNVRHPFADGKNHGSGAEWAQQFASTYGADPRIQDPLGGIPQRMLEAIRGSTADSDINIHLAPIDYFVPFCFDATSCLAFEDPLGLRGLDARETAALDLLVTFNLGDPDRGFIPGNLPGQPQVNTPSLRGLWWRSNFLHHGYAFTIAEAILPPGHSALSPNEKGFAINALGEIDVHGTTSTMSATDLESLILYLMTIE